MPNLARHIAIGAAAGGVTYLAMCKYLDREVDFGEFLFFTGASALFAPVPDVLEPAVDPNHRAFGHSLTLGAGLARLAVVQCNRKNTCCRNLEKILIAVLISSYLSHLLADACTPKGLPLLQR